MYGVLWTDAVQGIMMFAVAVILVMLPFIHAGGAAELMSRIALTTHPDRFGQPMGNGLVTFGQFVSLAAVLLIVGTAFIQDIWHVSRPIEKGRLVPRTRWTIFGYSILLYVFTLYPPAGIVELTAFSGAVFAASFFPAIFGGLYLRWGNDMGALASMLAGILSCVTWRFAFRFRIPELQDVHEVIPAFIVSVLVYLLVSKITAPRCPDQRHLDRLFAPPDPA